MKIKTKLLNSLVLSVLVVTSVSTVTAKDLEVQVKTMGGPVTPYYFKGSIKDLPVVENWTSGDPVIINPRRHFKEDRRAKIDYKMTLDPLAELQKNTATDKSSRAFGSTIINIDGMGYNGVAPPDPIGDIGKDYYIQSINGGSGAAFTIYNKADGTVASGPTNMSSIAPSGVCQTSAHGDPIILYDETVERWFMLEFTTTGPKTLCFYISATSDPVNGGWNFYQYTGVTFPDYPHFGIWPDAYYGTANEDTATVYAFDRTNMLAGTTARAPQAIVLGDLDGYGFQTATPADWDGILPPPNGAPGVIMRHVDEEAHASATNNATTDLLELYNFTVDFDNSANSSFVKQPDIVITDFNSYFRNYSTFATVPQPGGADLLDPIREVILNRLQYRNFGAYEVILGVLPTNINPATTGTTVNAGLRWYELRRTGGIANPWVLFQEGTYDPGSATENRLVGSVSMDESGNIALAYTKTDTNAGTALPPSVAYTGRLASDTNDVMTQTEVVSKAGTGINTDGRWGDYAAMGVDPTDGCTFWFTSEYQNGTNWGTSITSFKFNACGTPRFLLTSNDAAQNVCTMTGAVNVNGTINVLSINSFSNNVSLAFNPALPSGISGSVTPTTVTPGNTAALALTVAQSITAGSHTVTVEGMATGAPDHQLDFNINVTNTLPDTAVLTAPADNATGISGANIAYAWDAVAGAQSYLIEIATDAAFTNIVDSATVMTNSFVSAVTIASSSTAYWRVTATNICGAGTVSSVFSFVTSTEICFTTSTAITDNTPAGVDMTLSVANTGPLASTLFSAMSDHTYPGDLIFTLTHNGTSVILMDRAGFPATNFGCGQDGVDVLFDDTSGTPVEGVCEATSPGITGTLAPEQALSAFATIELSGDWVLNVSDNEGLDTGNITQFCLIPTVASADLIFENGFEVPAP